MNIALYEEVALKIGNILKNDSNIHPVYQAAYDSAYDAVQMIKDNGDLRAEAKRVADGGNVHDGDGDWDIVALASIHPRFQGYCDEYILETIAPAVKTAENMCFSFLAGEALGEENN